MPTALVVDDHPAIRLAVRSRLTEDLDFDTVTEVTNGADALRVLRDAIADLIVVDLSLPGVPGEALLAELVSRHPATRVLVLSAMTGAGERAIHGGAHGYVDKGDGLHALTPALRAVMQGFAVFPTHLLPTLRRLSAVAGDPARILSRRELTVLRMLASGHTNKAISELLEISNKTVSSHKANIMSKLKFKSLIELAEFARRHHLL
ncbi:two component transcriptional regulator, LuxR family [Cupriavidus sp. OV038]|jgi:two-component system response regulator EvgA|uniref:response regulator transcription factor n=1 Tax=unclassified Cupriavidus TaxID=2640874 RepID=UPI0008F18682|nr:MULTISPECIES: response regulator transcription factor [unclassified Cupriavidus]SFC85494.1 two component transcriptional regulator, LuxR family [Cupriavidus sp. OV038]SFO80957.1 two component transcriptional regulator, LuxR family [Cupriavidus sp. OV096]